MMSFYARLVSGSDDVHRYRVVLDGGEREFDLVLDTAARQIVATDPEGAPVAGFRLCLDSGDIDAETPVERAGIRFSRAEFAPIAVHLRDQWSRNGAPPTGVVRYFG
ncbi:hypothetical protein RM844_30085 [Streptomyces sp. DSM 44915]|uniref:Uncharacterized protein n=1 Tax=Streptomyces chisholmiae TaxID=3075540 RepID=A0ABU2K012_9ACTN|nr:hypothetical protein [Streptomyces sp. DSM 44915]MDT0270530.1 hypothetical protein [Streptomyces sp. DSM 44915]